MELSRPSPEASDALRFSAGEATVPVGGTYGRLFPIGWARNLNKEPPAAATFAPLYCLLLAALWILTRPYMGIIHDARLYMVQALERLHPHMFAGDMWFAFGSQGRFTIFSWLYDPMVEHLGPYAAHLTATVLGELFWFSALLFLTRALFRHGRTWIMAAAGVVLLNPYYGGLYVFSYGERFATPRLFAEALVILAIAAVVRRRWTLAALWLVPALLIHPLMTLPGIGVAAVLAAWEKPKLWWTYLAGALVLVALAAAGVGPFDRLFERFDPAWFAIVYKRCDFAFVTRWGWISVAIAAGPIAGLVMGLTLGSPTERRLLRTIAMIAAAGVVVTLLGGDLARDVLVVNLQPWRALWLLALAGNACAGAAVVRLPAGSAARKFVVLGIGCSLVETRLWVPPFMSSIAFGTALLAMLRERTPPDQRSRALDLAGATLGVCIVGGLLTVVWVLVPSRSALVGADRLIAYCVLTALGALLLVPGRRLSARPVLAWGLVLAVLAGSVGIWDQRTPWTRFLENGKVPVSLAHFVAGQRHIYWELGVDLLWLKLERPSYFSCLQGSGVMFFRKTAIEYQRRANGLAVLNTLDFANGDQGFCPQKRIPHQQGPVSRRQLVAACRSLPALDAMVLTRKVDGVPSTEWRAPVGLPVMRHGAMRTYDVFHMYRCGELR